MDQALAIEDLVKRFGDLTAVDKFSLSVAPGEVFGLIGPDGAGKTTTMRLVAGLMTPDSGTITALGFDIPREMRRARVSVGYMPQQYSLYGDLSVQENLRFFAGMYGVPKQALLEREKRLLGIARLEEFRSRPAAALSGGMYKKLALSCALIHSPQLLLLDEPTNGVDPISRRELWAFLEELVQEGVAVLISTPYMDEAERCGRVGLLVEGKLVTVGTPGDLKSGFRSTVFELVTSGGLLSSGIFSNASGIDQIYAVGRKLRLVSSRGPAFVASIEAILREHKIDGARVGIVPASFEDIFLDISSRASTVQAQP
jgi:ABC-2 type transport system ATP-binding protein